MDLLIRFLQSALFVSYSVFWDWGWALVGLTFVLRLFLLPLQAFSLVHQRRLEAIKPQLDSIHKRFKDSPADLFREASLVKKRAGVKTWAIVMTTVIQLPIFYAMFKMVTCHKAFMTACFGWIPSLSSPDPLFLLPLVVAGVCFFQQKRNPAGDAAAKQVGAIMPILSFFFMFKLPAALVLYYSTSSLLQLLGDSAIRKWIV